MNKNNFTKHLKYLTDKDMEKQLIKETYRYLKDITDNENIYLGGSVVLKLNNFLHNHISKDLDFTIVQPTEQAVKKLKDLEKTYPVERKNNSSYAKNENLISFNYNNIVDVDVFITDTPFNNNGLYWHSIPVIPANTIIGFKKNYINSVKQIHHIRLIAAEILS